MPDKYVFAFEEGRKEQKFLLGGKGANLAEMTILGLPVPPGFTITTEACNAYMAGGNQLPSGLMAEVATAREVLEQKMGKQLGAASDPLLVSVRSGAPFSRPCSSRGTASVHRTTAGSKASPTISAPR